MRRVSRRRRAIAPQRPYMSAMRAEDILIPTPAGLYCPPGGFHIDPTRPVARALITHAHSDHARAGHGAVLATPETIDLMRLRYGENFAGTAQAVALWRAAADRRRRGELSSRRPCARLGADRGRGPRPARRGVGRLQGRGRPDLPAVRAGRLRRLHHRGDVRAAGVPSWRSERRDRQAVALRRRFFPSGRISSAPIRSARRNASSRCCGRPATIADLSPRRAWRRSRDTTRSAWTLARCGWCATPAKAELAGAIALCPPSALHERWARRFPDPVTAFASGWMRVRARARQRRVELPLVISDHADWDGLTATIAATGASEIWVTHGAEDALVHWCGTRGLDARPLHSSAMARRTPETRRKLCRHATAEGGAHEPVRGPARPPRL